MTISAETHDRLCRVRALLGDALPDGDPAAIHARETERWFGERLAPSPHVGP